MESQTVVVLGASSNPNRYSYRAVEALVNSRHSVIPVNPSLPVVHGIQAVGKLDEIAEGTVDTLTLYLSPVHSEPLINSIIKLHPKRVIANPGAESKKLSEQIEKSGIEVIEACTLVMITTNSF